MKHSSDRRNRFNDNFSHQEHLGHKKSRCSKPRRRDSNSFNRLKKGVMSYE